MFVFAGLVGVVDQAEQEPVEWVEPLKLLDRDRDGRKQPAPEPSMPSSGKFIYSQVLFIVSCFLFIVSRLLYLS